MKKIYTYIFVYSVLLFSIMQVQAKPTTDSTYQKNLKKFAQILKLKPKQIVFNYEVTPDGDFFFKEYINGEDNTEHILPISSDTASYSESYLNIIRELAYFDEQYNDSDTSHLKLYIFHGRYFLGHTFYTQNSTSQNEKNLKKVIGNFNRENKDQITQNKNIYTLQKDLVKTIKESTNAPKRIFILFIVENYETRYKNKKGALFASQKYFFVESGLTPEEKTAACLAEQKAATFVEGWDNDYKRMNTSAKIIRTYMEGFYKQKNRIRTCTESSLPEGKKEIPYILNLAQENDKKVKPYYLLDIIEDSVKIKLNKNAQDQYPFIHLVSHGIYGDAAGTLTTSLDKGENCKEGSYKNGQLTYGEILNLKIGTPDLVVINSCQSRVGVNSIAEGFHKIGAKATIGTTNNIGDASGYLFSKFFYAAHFIEDIQYIPQALLNTRIKMLSERCLLKDWSSYIFTSKSHTKAMYENTTAQLKENQAIIKIYKFDNEYKARIITKNNLEIVSLGSVNDVLEQIEYLGRDVVVKGRTLTCRFWNKIENVLSSDIDEILISASDNFLYQTYGFSFNAILSEKKQKYIGLIYKITYLL